MRKTIYVKDAVRWEGVKDAAEKLGIGIGEYLLGSRKVVAPDLVQGQLDRIERKLDKLLECGKMGCDIPQEQEAIDLAEAQKKLDAEKASRNIKEEKIKLVRSQIRSYSKAQQLGKN